MRFTESARRALGVALCVGAAGPWLASCTSTPLPPYQPPAAPATPVPPAAPQPGTPGAATEGAPGTSGDLALQNLPPRPTRIDDWQSFKIAAAYKLITANPVHSFTGPVPEPLLGIPILDIELNADGSVKHIEVVRTPPRAPNTVQRAIEAVRKAAPFPAVAHLPRPWTYRETFLYAEDGRFKPRTLDQ